MRDPKRHLVTSALPYANGALHLGHLAGAYLPADIYVRTLRLLGKDVVFVCGSDEHGAAITMKAKLEGVTPREIIDKYHELNKETFQRLGISFDIYHRTSSALHAETAQAFFTELYTQGGEFEERMTEQYFDEEFQQFLADRYIVGTCPRCGNPEAYGDQCENCGSTLSPTELIQPRSVLSGKTPVLKLTKHWYFKLEKHADWLRTWIEKGELDGVKHHDPKRWKKHVTGQCLSWLDSGLQPRAITRDLDWGIPVPLEEAKGKVLYVWFDAPIGYISATRQWALDHGKNWEDYWKSPDSQLVHFIGKDNIVFHCIVFPAMLKAHGDYLLPVNVPANQFLNFESRKFSKSKGWGIEQHEYLETFKDFPNKEDTLRYALIRNMPETRDSDFKWDEFVDFHDKELADNLGNFLNRVIVLTQKYYEGRVPEGVFAEDPHATAIRGLVKDLVYEIESFSFKDAVQKFLEISTYGNVFLQDTSPWAIWKDEPDSLVVKDCLYTCLQIVTVLSVIVEPFLPFTAKKIRAQLQLPEAKAGALAELLERLESGKELLPAGHLVGQPEVLFPKINDRKDGSRMELVEAQKAKLVAVLAAEQPEPKTEYATLKDLISYDDFAKMDIRTGTILEAEKVPKADRLLKLLVDLGFEKRTIVAGIAEHFQPEAIIGQQVLVLANLAPRPLKGIESNGMILMAGNEEGKLSFVTPEKGWPNGFGVK
ncbi:MAG: methionine--tRNA ligase [Saprospirales bacterium]|nr:methionine--tRNA ligase [Saprospirales bacterium]